MKRVNKGRSQQPSGGEAPPPGGGGDLDNGGNPFPATVVARSKQSVWNQQYASYPRAGHTRTQLTTGNLVALLGASGYNTASNPQRICFTGNGLTLNDIDFSGWRVFFSQCTGVTVNDCKFQMTGDLLLTVGATTGQSVTTGANVTFNWCEFDGIGQSDLFANTVYGAMLGNTAAFNDCLWHRSPRTHIMTFGVVSITRGLWKPFGVRAAANGVHCNGIHQGSGEVTITDLMCDMRTAGGITQPATLTAMVFHEGFQAAITKGIVQGGIFVGIKRFGAATPTGTGDGYYSFRNQNYTYGSHGVKWIDNIIEAGISGNHILDSAGPMSFAQGDRRYDNFDFDTGARIGPPNDPAEITP